MKQQKKRWKAGALGLAAGAALAAGTAWAFQDRLEVTWYDAALPEGLEGLDELKIAQISDVHSADLQEELCQALEQAAPDILVFTGDLVNREDQDLSRALSLTAAAAQIAPAYYAPGNHEADNPGYPELREALEQVGVTVLEDEAAQLWRNGEQLNLIGLRDLTFHPQGRERGREELPDLVRELSAEGALNVVLSHRPSLMAEYAQSGAGLVFSGHAHGGQVRLPFVGPLFAPDEGVFPNYTAGVYRTGETQVVVSRGLGNGTPFPRLWNRPELVIVTLRAGK